MWKKLHEKWEEIPWPDTTKKLMLLLVGVVVVSSGLFIYDLALNPTTKSVTDDKITTVSAKYPIYSVVQDKKARVMIYNTLTQQHFQLFSIDVGDNTYGFYADYSVSANKVVFSDDKGIGLFDLKTKKINHLIENKTIPEDLQDTPGAFSYINRNPKWSPDGKTISYQKGSDAFIIDENGKVIASYTGKTYSSIENTLLADLKGDKYLFQAVTSIDPIDASLSIITKDKLTEVKEIFKSNVATTKDYYLNETTWSPDGLKIYLLLHQASDAQGKQIASINSDGTGYQVIKTYNSEIIDSIFVDTTGVLYYSKIEETSNKGKGLFDLSSDGKSEELFFQDGDKLITPKSSDKKHLIALSNDNYPHSDSIKNLLMIDKKNRTAISLGEANKIDFIGWIQEDKIPTGLEKTSIISPTDAEKDAYKLSLKTKSWLFNKFYDYCWDYDCTSATYPFPKLVKSTKGEIINISKPLALTGNVIVPVVFFYDDQALPDSMIEVLTKATDAVNSLAYMSNWLNDQAKSAKQNLQFSFRYMGQQKLNPDCIGYDETVLKAKSTCIRQAAETSFSEIKSSTVMVAILVNSDQKHYISAATEPAFVSEDKKATITLNGSTLLYYAKDQSMFENYFKKSGDIYAKNLIKTLLNLYGAQNKIVAYYKKPADNTNIGCIVGPANDIMCDYILNNKEAPHSLGSYYTISEITQKELGWYDLYGNGKHIVDEK